MCFMCCFCLCVHFCGLPTKSVEESSQDITFEFRTVFIMWFFAIIYYIEIIVFSHSEPSFKVRNCAFTTEHNLIVLNKHTKIVAVKEDFSLCSYKYTSYIKGLNMRKNIKTTISWFGLYLSPKDKSLKISLDIIYHLNPLISKKNTTFSLAIMPDSPFIWDKLYPLNSIRT